MINEVNKLIFNTVIRHKSLHLPDVGTLSIVRQPATISSNNQIIPPRYIVELSQNNEAVSLIDTIISETGVEPNRAKEIYYRWLDKSREGSMLKIGGVGVIDNNSLRCDNELIKRLNINNEPLFFTRKRSFKPLWAVLSCAVVICLIYGGWHLYNNRQIDITELVTIVTDESNTSSVESLNESNSVDNSVITANTDNVDTLENTNNETEIEEVTTKELDWRKGSDIRHWVVVGSYSTVENAERAIADIEKRMPDAKCDYFKLGSMYAVAAFGSSESNVCQEYKRAHIDDFPQAWVYTPKRYR